MKYIKQNTWFPCYKAYYNQCDNIVIISKLNNYWKVGIYKDYVCYQPNTEHNGYLGSYKTLQRAKKIATNVIKNTQLTEGI